MCVLSLAIVEQSIEWAGVSAPRLRGFWPLPSGRKRPNRRILRFTFFYNPAGDFCLSPSPSVR
jgi:hypothetical protein